MIDCSLTANHSAHETNSKLTKNCFLSSEELPVKKVIPALSLPSRAGNRIVEEKLIRRISLCLLWILALSLSSAAKEKKSALQEISNDTLRLRLNVTAEGIPVIEQAEWIATGQTAFRDLGTPDGLNSWITGSLLPFDQPPISWKINEDDNFITAEATRALADRFFITWVVELSKQGQLIRLHVRLTNNSRGSRSIDSFPVWLANWDVGGQSQWVRWWKSIQYDRVEQTLGSVNKIRLSSTLYSSDDTDNGVNPYWIVGGPDSRVFFGLQWCGGWNAKIQSLDRGFNFSVTLPSEEAQLVLNRGDVIDGPTLFVMPSATSDDVDARSNWMRQRHSFGRLIYPTPSLTFPLTYNHWYAIRRQVDDVFLNRQIAAMSPYSFDAFIIDAGWFADGKWKPDSMKFKPGEFEELLGSLRAMGVKPGLWSAPQYVSTQNNDQLALSDPPVMSSLPSGFLVDLTQDDFTSYLLSHIGKLRNKYSVDYWKYDKDFFSQQSRAGKMRSVIAFQDSMQAVRRANPDLFIENCLNGGRMINEFTLLATQATWLSDLGQRDPDPRENISVALNAIDFIFPWAALRFTKNFDSFNPNDDETAKLYCRSAMAGIWGISSDLALISDRQREVILKEIGNYRRLNVLKYSCLYDVMLPSDSADVAGVTFYSGKRLNAGMMLYRWKREGAFEQHVTFPKLKSWARYRVVDVDTGNEIIALGSDLNAGGIDVPFEAGRLSALLFVDPVKHQQP